MRKILLTLILIGSITTAFAQKADPEKFSIGLEGGIPLASARAYSTFTVGGSLKYNFTINDKVSLTASAGYIYFPYRADATIPFVGYGTTNKGEGYIPLKGGVKYFISDVFYVEGQAGAAISTATGGGTAFAYSPGVGYRFDTHADIGIRFESWLQNNSTINQVALRLAYSF